MVPGYEDSDRLHAPLTGHAGVVIQQGNQVHFNVLGSKAQEVLRFTQLAKLPLQPPVVKVIAAKASDQGN